MRGLMKLPILIASMAILLSLSIGCAPAITQRYASSAKNVAALRDLNVKNKVKLGKFQGDKKLESCRLADIAPPDNLTFANFIKNALSEDLIMAGLYSEAGNKIIEGNLTNIDLACGITDASWTIGLEIISPGREPFAVEIVYKFEGAYIGDTAFSNAQQALMPAVQELIKAIVNHPKFYAILDS